MSGNFPMSIRSGGICEDEIICRKLNKVRRYDQWQYLFTCNLQIFLKLKCG